MYFIIVDDSVVDGRRIQGELNMDAIYTALSSLATPSGASYTFITDTDALSSAVPVSECFKHAIQGPVVREDWHKFETSIKSGLFSVNAGKVHACTNSILYTLLAISKTVCNTIIISHYILIPSTMA